MGRTREAQIFRSAGLHPPLASLTGVEWRITAVDGPLITALVRVFEGISQECGGGKVRCLTDGRTLAIDVSHVPRRRWYAFIDGCIVLARKYGLTVQPIVPVPPQRRRSSTLV